MKNDTSKNEKGIDTMANKMTKREMFGILKENFPADHARYAEVMAGIDHELELLAKKSASNSAKSDAMDAVRQAVLEYALENMDEGKGYSATELAKMCEGVYAELCPNDANGLSNQRMTAIIKRGIDNGSIVKMTDKRKTLFYKA